MNRSELRTATKRVAEHAARASGNPSLADIAEARALFALRKEQLSSEVSSNVRVKFAEKPDWNSWPSIAQFFDAYHAALVGLDNRLAGPMAKIRLTGI
jgi:hypothetical protein